MTNERIDQVNVTNPYGSMAPNYKQSDMERIYHDAKPSSWQDLVHFLETKGDKEWHITPGEAVAMKNDIQQLIKHNVPFTDNPDKAFQEAHKYRSQDRAEEEPQLKEHQRS